MPHPADLIKLVFGVVEFFLQFVEGGVFELGRVGGGVDLLEFANGDLGVDLGGGEFGVAESRHGREMKRMSAPFSCMRVAQVCRKRWKEPFLPSSAASM